ncbi:hypothetical protein [Streptomyces hilarionis]|uniref:hypothetical protein n=1 Tax=Streptomyces hilarionis TaxID=2839954 RepID=UPI002119B774|nr:hypothetical protein [Streptomyces hilarionis]MCQ9129605.1 hypothetical protein [Streptomyces hilarionis]
MKKTMMRRASAALLLACCCLPLTACGTEHPGARAGAGAGQGSSTTDGTSDDDQGSLPDTTTDDQGTLPDTTTDDQGTLPDTTSDDQGTLPDTTTDDQGSEPANGPHRWFPMLREFRAYLATDASAADSAIASHVTSVRVRVPAGGARSEAVVRVDYGVGEEERADRAAAVFAHWREAVYGDHGHVEVLGPAKTTAEKNW